MMQAGVSLAANQQRCNKEIAGRYIKTEYSRTSGYLLSDHLLDWIAWVHGCSDFDIYVCSSGDTLRALHVDAARRSSAV